MSIDEERLMAFADGELHGAEREEIERAVAQDPRLRARLDEQRRLRAALQGRYGPVAEEPVPGHLLAMLGGRQPENVASLAEARERRRVSQRPVWRNFGAIAATLAVGVLAGQLIPRGSDPLAVEEGVLVARGELAAALETQLASAQDPAADTRIGVTFADRSGRACRTFDSRAASGLACREGEHWAVVMTSAGALQSGEYRQAGSSGVLQAAQEMMAGEPLDAAAERAAMKAGWKISPQPTD
jgi:hypothetical protein